MASFPPIPQIVGNHGPVFEAYYKQADPNNTGSIGALDAASFLKKSGVKENILSQIWDISDPTGRGYLEKNGFFVALKMIALVQNGLEPSVAKILTDTPQPNLGPVEIIPDGVVAGGPLGGIPWTVGASEKSKYDQVFDSLLPTNNMLSGDKVKPVLMNSKLPMDVLGRIWELSDIDKDGYLDRDEFALVMHLVHKGMAKEAIPMSLTPNMIPPSKRKVPIGGINVLAGIAVAGQVGGRNSPVVRADSPALRAANWVVSPAEKHNYDQMFRKADLDMDGFVSGQEIRALFLQSGLQNNILAHIWALCDMQNIGKLNSEQFALAMYLVQQKMKGIDPPAQLTPEMIPPSMRPQQGTDGTSFGVGDGQSAGPFGHVADSSALKELDMLQKEIDEIKQEKLKIEANQQQYLADIRISQGEVQTLEKELSAANTSLHQLEAQKVEAQKCLDDLDDKKSKLETCASEIKQKCEDEQKQIDSLNSQIQNQAKSAMEQDEELNRLRIELRDLREDENKLEQRVESGKLQLEQLTKSQKDLSLQVNQTKTRVQHLQDQYRSIQQGIAEFSSSSDIPTVFANSRSDDQYSSTATQGSPVSTISDFSMGSMGSALDEDPFKKDPFGGAGAAAQADPFAGDDPFKGDPFKSEGFTSDPFASDDPFKEAFPTSNSTAPKDDPFSSSDPFGSSFSSSPSSAANANFDPFGSSSSTSSSKPQKSSGDLFGNDPFVPQPAKSGPESPRPALPPKQKKAPPPRPAPPKKSPASSPSKASKPDLFGAFPNDPFGSSDPFGSPNTGVSGGGGDSITSFADFSPGKASTSTFSDDDLAWAFSSSTSNNNPKLSKIDQEHADFEYALKLSRGEVPDSEA